MKKPGNGEILSGRLIMDNKKRARDLFEIEGVKPPTISKMLGVPRSTVYFWKQRNDWGFKEETPEVIVLREFKRIIAKPEYSNADLRKLKNLRNILDEYENRRSLLAKDIQIVVDKHRGGEASSRLVINELITLLNTHTGSTMRVIRDLSGKQPANDFRESQYADTANA